MASHIERRKFLATLLGSAAAVAWPLMARAQQAAMPVVTGPSSPDEKLCTVVSW